MSRALTAAQPSSRHVARHEAAHAVVAVRLHLPLVSVTIRRGAMQRAGLAISTNGQTKIDPAAKHTWLAALPDPIAVERLAALGAYTAGGAIADQSAGLHSHHQGTRGDWNDLHSLAYMIGVDLPAGTAVKRWWLNEAGQLTYNAADLERVHKHPAFHVWFQQSMRIASNVLYHDDGAAWDRVRVGLERKRFLDAAEVRQLVAASDAARAA